MKKRNVFSVLLLMMWVGALHAGNGFVHVKGTDLIQPDGRKLFIQGTNLGN